MMIPFVPVPDHSTLGQTTAEHGGMNADAFDGWSIVHFTSGVAMGLIGIPLGWTVGIATAYEIAEYAHEWPSGSRFFGSKRPESGLNIATDMALLLLGWGIVNKLR